MQCFRCQFEVAEFAVYCNRCGAQLRARCTDCGRMNPGDSHFCDACGKQLRPSAHAAQPEASVVTPPPQTHVDCPRCSTVNELGSVYCYSCGLPLDEAQPKQNSPIDDYDQRYDGSSNLSVDGPGGFWIRLVAIVVDFIIVSVLSIAVASALGVSVTDWWSEYWMADEWGFGAFDGISLAIEIVYFTGLVSALSATIGKVMFGLVVVRNDGSKIGIGRAFFRMLCYNISLLILGIGFLMIAFRRDKRGLHDLICDTKVVYR